MRDRLKVYVKTIIHFAALKQHATAIPSRDKFNFEKKRTQREEEKNNNIWTSFTYTHTVILSQAEEEKQKNV